MNRSILIVTVLIGITFNAWSIPIDTTNLNKGIHFESGLSWQEILAKAKAENKYILVDCFATWCGPCKWMDKNIYPDKEVGLFYNEHFINVAVQMDRTLKDDKSVQDWYEDAGMIKRTFNVGAYPTYLFFTPDGQIIHRYNGSTIDKREFISKGKDAMEPDKQYYTLLKQWKNHKGDSAYLLQALQNAKKQGDKEHVFEIGNYYLDCLQDPIAKDNIQTICWLIRVGERKFERALKIFLDNAGKINRTMEDSLYTERNLASIIFEDDISPFFLRKDSVIYWSDISDHLRVKYPMLSAKIVDMEEYSFKLHIDLDIKEFIYSKDLTSAEWEPLFNRFKNKYRDYVIEPVFLERKAKYYAMKKMWNECADASYSYIHKYGDQIESHNMNNIAWDFIFVHSDKMEILLEAIKWMEQAVKQRPNDPSYLDTYANLLYKVGKKEDAISWDTKAIDAANKILGPQKIKSQSLLGSLKAYEMNLVKMSNGLPTWGDDISGS
jgi:thioredoxin-related protein